MFTSRWSPQNQAKPLALCDSETDSFREQTQRAGHGGQYGPGPRAWEQHRELLVKTLDSESELDLHPLSGWVTWAVILASGKLIFGDLI